MMFAIKIIAVLGTCLVLSSAFRDLLKKKITMDLLASVALIFSVLSREWTSAAFISLMVGAAKLLAFITQKRAERNIKSLFKMRPKKAKVLENGNIKEVLVDEIKVRDKVVVDLGDQIPIDGVLISGEIEVDESTLTGESVPITKKVGDKVFSSTIIVSGGGQIEAEKVGKDTSLEKMIALIESSGQMKPHFQTIGERFGKIYLAGIFLISILVYLITRDSRLVLSIILVICADDVAVAVPLAYLSATRLAAKNGVVIKGTYYLEALGHVDTIVFDKTGTLTTGQMAIDEIKSFSNFGESELISFCGSLVGESHHPVSRAIDNYARERNVKLGLAQEVVESAGMGLSGIYENKQIIFGRESFLHSRSVKISDEVLRHVADFEGQGKTVSFIVVSGELAGVVTLSNEIRPNAKSSIEHLRKLGIKNIVMLTGDNENAARVAAEKVGIHSFHSRLLPEDKLEYIRKYIEKGGKLAMVGDGVNDAAALRMATVGIAMGTIGYDAAIESADIVLMKDNLSKIASVVEIARFTRRISIEDFWIWGVSNVLGLSLVFGGIIGPAGAAAYNFLTDFFPLFNSLRANRAKKR